MMPRIVFSRTPRRKLRLEAIVQARREAENRADVQIAIGPAIQSAADAACEGVVDGRMAQGAGDADTGHIAPGVDSSDDADDRIQPKQFHRDGGILQVHLIGLKRSHERRWQRFENRPSIRPTRQ